MIYYLMIVSVVILYLLFRRRSKKYFIIGTWAILFLFQACRKYELWGDLIGYNKKHQSLGYYQNFSNLARMFLADSKDIGYYIAEWIAVRLGVSFQVWIVIIAFVFLSSVCILIYRKSIYPLISILTFISLGFFIFSLSGLRQTIAIAIVIWSYYFLEEKKIIRFIFLIIFASYFHKTALCFLIILPIARIVLGKWHIIVAVLCGLGFSVFSSQINIFLEKYILINEYVGYVGSEIKLNYTGFIIQSAIFVFCLLYYKQVTKNRNNLILYNLSFMGMVLQLYSSVIAEFFRVSMYFSIFDIILVPLVLEHEKERRNRSLLLFLVTSVLILYIFIQGEIKYDVFWR